MSFRTDERSRAMTRRIKRSRPGVESLEGRALLTAGALDTTFGGTGKVAVQLGTPTNYSPTSESRTALVQPADGKVILAGAVYSNISATSGSQSFTAHGNLFRVPIDLIGVLHRPLRGGIRIIGGGGERIFRTLAILH